MRCESIGWRSGDSENVPLEIDHLHSRGKGGDHRVSHLTMAGHHGNQRKRHLGVAEFLARKPEKVKRIRTRTKTSFCDAAAINSTRWVSFRRPKARGLDVEVGTGGRTKWNRRRLSIPQAHCLHAACAGHGEPLNAWQRPMSPVKAAGWGAYPRPRLTKQGFPRRSLTRRKRPYGLGRGDVANAIVVKGQMVGTYLGRAAVRAGGRVNLQTGNGLVQGIRHRSCTLIRRADGDGYSGTKIASNKGEAGMGQAMPAALSLPGSMNDGVSRATG